MKHHSFHHALWLLVLLLSGLSSVEAPSICNATVPPANSAESRPVQILVAYYSRTGNTERMARGVVEGVERADGVMVMLRKVGDVTKGDLDSADGIILGCPAYFANIPGEMKTIIDDWNWKMKADLTDKIGGVFATAGGQIGTDDGQ